MQRQLRARRWVAVVKAGSQGPPLFSTEADLYRSAAAPGQALAEFQQATANCPSSFISSPYSGGASLRWSFSSFPGSSTWPQTAGVARLVTVVRTTFASGLRGASYVNALLARGDVLLFVDLPVVGTTASVSTEADGLVQSFSGRLAAAIPAG